MSEHLFTTESSDQFQSVCFCFPRTALKFTVDDSNIQLFPETDEAVKILNIKRGIISALMVPMKEEKRSRSVNLICILNFNKY